MKKLFLIIFALLAISTNALAVDIWMDVDTALSEVPINIFPLTDDTDFKTREVALTYDQAGLDLVWNFVTTAGAMSQTAVTPTEAAGDYDWAHQGDGMYTIEIPASAGASINNDTEGHGWFTGYATGVLPWRGPIIGFRDSDLNDKLIDSAWSATRGLAGTAVPDAAADGAGGLPISDAGGLDLDTKLANTNEVTAARMSELDAGTGGKMANQVDIIQTDTTTDIPALIGSPADLGGGTATLAGNLADIESQTDDIGVAGAGLTNIDLPNQTMDIVGDITGDLSGSVGSVTAGVTLADDAITAAKIAANAITTSELANDTITADKIADNAFGIEHYQDDIYGLNLFEAVAIVLDKTAGPKLVVKNGDEDWDLYYFRFDAAATWNPASPGTPVCLYEEVDSDGQTLGPITITAPF